MRTHVYEVSEKRGRGAGNRHSCIHRAVSTVPVVGNGGDASPEHPAAAPLTARLSLSAACGLAGETAAVSRRHRAGRFGRSDSVPREEPRPVVKRQAHSRGGWSARAVAARSGWSRLAAALAAASMLMASGGAAAGDFYLRAAIGVDRPAETAFTDRDCANKSPAALYGCGRGGDGAPLRAVGEFGTAAALELGFGYAATRALRLEVAAEYRPRLAFEGRANFLEPGRRQSVAADLSSLSAMLAAYVDLPGLGVPRLGPFSPFVGAGVGAARTGIGETRMTFPRTTTIVPGAGRTGVAWMVTAGLSTALSERTTLDFAWRYTDLGEVRTGRGEGRVVWRDGSREPLLLDLAATRAKLRSHGLRLSLRYAF